MMFTYKCAHCGKEYQGFAKDRTGKPYTVYCSTKCENNARYEQRFIDPRRLK
jgi:DNA-directed RNA polymerase subunit RPC12/RpoP